MPSKTSDQVTILKNLPASTSLHATRTQYERLMAARPQKFTAAQVAYRAALNSKERCEWCVHFYKNPALGRATCEVFRPEDDTSVAADFVCDFFSDDYEHFPLLK